MNSWTRQGFFYHSTYILEDGEHVLTVVRSLDLISYHLIKWRHGEAKLIEMANKRPVIFGESE